MDDLVWLLARARPWYEAERRRRLRAGRELQARLAALGTEATLELCADAAENGWADDLLGLAASRQSKRLREAGR